MATVLHSCTRTQRYSSPKGVQSRQLNASHRKAGKYLKVPPNPVPPNSAHRLPTSTGCARQQLQQHTHNGVQRVHYNDQGMVCKRGRAAVEGKGRVSAHKDRSYVRGDLCEKTSVAISHRNFDFYSAMATRQSRRQISVSPWKGNSDFLDLSTIQKCSNFFWLDP